MVNELIMVTESINNVISCWQLVNLDMYLRLDLRARCHCCVCACLRVCAWPLKLVDVDPSSSSDIMSTSRSLASWRPSDCAAVPWLTCGGSVPVNPCVCVCVYSYTMVPHITNAPWSASSTFSSQLRFCRSTVFCAMQYVWHIVLDIVLL